MSAVAPGAGETLPSPEDIESWPTQHLDDAATRWRAAAGKSVETFEQHHRNVASPAGTEWTGIGNDAAVNRAASDLGVVRHHSDVKSEAADLAASGATDISAVKRLAVEAIAEAREDGFTVNPDLSVTDARAYDINTIQQRNKAAKEHAEFIRFRAHQLVATDALVGSQLKVKAAELQGIKFEGEGDDHGAHVQLVDNKTTVASDGTDQPGAKPDEKPSGAGNPDHPPTLADLMLPPDTPGGATPRKPGDKPTNAMDLIADGQAKADKPGDGQRPQEAQHPKTVQDMLLPDGPPAAAGPGSQPKFDPKTPEGRAGLAMARQVLMNDPRVPPGEVEQRLAAMTAQAQHPLPPPPVHEPGPKPPIPGLGERLGDKLNNFTNNMHEGFYERGRETLTGIENLTGTGGPGHPGVSESWKQLAHGTIDDIRNDPLRYHAAQREGHEMVDDPGRYAGKTLFDGTVAAATAPLAGEGLLARGAAEGAVTHGVEHGIEHGVQHGAPPVATHDAVPVAPHGPADIPPAGDHGLFGHGDDTGPPSGSDHASHPIGPLPQHGEPGSFGYDHNGDRLPYANGGRPGYGPGQVGDVWTLTRDEQMDQIGGGLLNLPEPGADQQWVKLHPNGPVGDDWTVENGHRLIQWQPGDSRNGLWDMGHVENREYRDLKDAFLRGDISYQEFMSEYRNPQNYRVQDWYRNRSHIDEGP